MAKKSPLSDRNRLDCRLARRPIDHQVFVWEDNTKLRIATCLFDDWRMILGDGLLDLPDPTAKGRIYAQTRRHAPVR